MGIASTNSESLYIVAASMVRIQVKARSWNRFILRNFGVEEAVLGAQHSFQFQDKNVILKLPGIETLNQGEFEDRKISRFSWRKIDGKILDAKYDVYCVDLSLTLNENVKIAPEMLEKPLKQIDLLSQQEQHNLDHLTSTYGRVARQAFEYWIRVVRWIAIAGRIGQPELVGNESGWSTYLLDENTGHRFWAEPSVFTVQSSHIITPEEWALIQDKLNNQQNSPIWFNLLFEGQYRKEHGDLNGAVVNCTVACEALIRRIFTQHFPNNLNGGIGRILDEINIMQIFNKFFKKEFDDINLKKIYSNIHKLFEMRNDILHTGFSNDLTEDSCKTMCDAATSFVVYGDRYIDTRSYL